MKSTKTKKSTSQHANQKLLKIAVIVVAVIIVLSVLFLLPKKQFAGKAVEFGIVDKEGTGGIGAISGTVVPGETFKVHIVATVTEKGIVAAGFKLKYPPSLLEVVDCTSIKGPLNPELEVFNGATCSADGTIEFKSAWLPESDFSSIPNFGINKTVAVIEFKAKDYVEIADKTAPLTFEEFTVLDLETNENIIKEVKNAEIKIVKQKESLCGNEKLDAEEFCDGALFSTETSSGCDSYGFIRGNATCKADCNIDFSPCEYSKEGEKCAVQLLPGAAEGSTTCENGLVCDAEESTCVKEKVSPITIQLIPKTGNVGELITLLQSGSLSANNEYLVNVTITSSIALPANHIVLILANYNDSIQKTQNFGTYPILELGKAENSIFNTLITASNGNVTFEVLVWNSLPSPDETFTPLMDRAAVTYAVK